ncbi:blastula protease 10-like isoform X2 [Babylonia areolata]|uniref:blastula protease 10-like isoform X2 n=1 Tax=Babylonia areolata TaxID=304850 RepID=UPI003FD16682
MFKTKMGFFRPFTIFCVWIFAQVSHVSAFTMDELISNAANSTEEFAFFQGNNEAPDVKVELDMIFRPEQWEEIQRASGTYGDESSGRKRRKAIRDAKYRWPNGEVPYELAPGVFRDYQRAEIDKALSEWQTYTCLKFHKARSYERNKIRFDNGGGCFSNVGKVGGAQTVGLAPGCRQKGVVIHEVGHAIGFQHEQTRPDRDRYVTILRQNIPPHLYYNFKKYSTQSVNNYDVPYDYYSIMHYGPKAFSVNGGLTIKTRDPKYQNVIGNRKGLSFRDIKLANLMYNCNARCTNKNVRCPGEGFMDKSCRCMCPGNPIRECTDTSTGGQTTPRVSTTTGSETGTNECVDRHRACSSWAARGECQRYRFYMSTYCKKSCRVCQEEKNTCRDMSEHCAFWKNKGYCRWKFVSYMRSNCAKSCNTCEAVRSDSEDSTTVDTRGDNGEGQEVGNGAMTSLPPTLSVLLMLVFSAVLH